MFGFGKKNVEENQDEITAVEWGYIDDAIGGTFGTRKHVDEVIKTYMPEIATAIFTASNNTKGISENQVAIARDVLAAIEDLKKQNEDEKRKNQELQAKYDALVERMAGYIERENGR